MFDIITAKLASNMASRNSSVGGITFIDLSDITPTENDEKFIFELSKEHIDVFSLLKPLVVVKVKIDYGFELCTSMTLQHVTDYGNRKVYYYTGLCESGGIFLKFESTGSVGLTGTLGVSAIVQQSTTT